MSQTQISMAVHRWFKQGEGWAFHPDLQPRLRRIVRAIEPRLSNRTTERFSCDFDGGQLVCDIFPDTSCANKLAAGRNPSVLRIACSTRKLSKMQTEDVYDQIDELRLPEFEGADELLLLPLSEDIQLAPVEIETLFSLPSENRPRVKKVVMPACPTWSILGGLLCVLISTVYSLLTQTDAVRWLIDMTLTICLAWTFYGLHRTNSPEEDLPYENFECDSERE